MFYRYLLSNKRIISASPDSLVYDSEDEGMVEVADDKAYIELTQVYRVTSDLSGVEVDPTYTPPPFDLSRDELKAILKLIVDQFNAVRTNVGMPEITYAQARDAIKAELGL